MIDWWLGFVHHSDEYRWWHPRDTRFGVTGRVAAPPGEYVGSEPTWSTSTSDPILRSCASISAIPAKILDKSRFKDAKVGTAIWAYVGRHRRDRLLRSSAPPGFRRRLKAVSCAAGSGLGEIDPAPDPKPLASRIDTDGS